MALVPRAYGAIPGRQQDADRLVVTEHELLTVLQQALADNARVATIRLGANIVLSRPVGLSGTYNVVVDGGGRYGFSVPAAFTGTELFTASSSLSNILFRDIAFAGPAGPAFAGATLLRLVGFAASGVLSNVSFERCIFSRILRVAACDSGSIIWRASELIDLVFGGLALGNFPNVATAQFERCIFQRLYGRVGSPASTRLVGIDDISGSVNNVAIEAGPLSVSGSASLLFGTSPVSQLGALALADGLTLGGAVTGPELRFSPNSVQSLSTANPSIATIGFSLINFTFAAGSSGTATLANGTEGQIAILRCLGNITGISLGDTTTVRLAGAWTPGTSGMLTLVYSGGVWLELSRSAN